MSSREECENSSILLKSALYNEYFKAAGCKVGTDVLSNKIPSLGSVSSSDSPTVIKVGHNTNRAAKRPINIQTKPKGWRSQKCTGRLLIYNRCLLNSTPPQTPEKDNSNITPTKTPVNEAKMWMREAALLCLSLLLPTQSSCQNLSVLSMTRHSIIFSIYMI